MITTWYTVDPTTNSVTFTVTSTEAEPQHGIKHNLAITLLKIATWLLATEKSAG